ncbi:glutamine-synthetase adenylyltransferase [Thalassobius sp. I31.1]|uniref:[protein-PII] uridylyltransferase family protein n=1 Tax=Thalassobius sp. I31.1 TaxID=2109912 RepID=UPI000D1B5624|nr:glutamine-synthetase adenylyltransferase [Thalassobius sp. I31.1]
MSFVYRLTRHPIPFDTDRGGEALALFPDTDAVLHPLLAGAGGCSPYLMGLMQREKTWLADALAGDPDAALQAEYARLREIPWDQMADELRRGKRRVALLTALADLGGVYSLEQVTGALTEFSYLATDLAMKAALAHEIRRKKLPGMTDQDLETGCGMVALAMGKMGAGELNYSSDIDLICVFDEERYAPEDYHDARASLIRATRKMAATLNDLTGEGYVFRTDLRLRPDPSVTPVCLSMEAAERYYESEGRTWERAAHIKAHPCAGDLEAGARYLKRLTPFIWRKHLDFAAIQDAHDMRLRIRDHKGLGGAFSLPGHNMKLGRGGIREIEFFTQTRQIIAGGRDPDLRSRETVPGLRALVAKDWVPEAAAELLITRYRDFREVEHRLQMINDAQTHSLPTSDEGFQRLACFMGESDVEAFKSRLSADLQEVHDLTESFFAPDGVKANSGPELSETEEEILSRWPGYPALRTSRAQEIFARVRPEILSRMQKAADPAEALTQFDGFLAGLPAGVQLFSLFEANPQLIDLLVDICATAPALAKYLSKNAKVLDAVIGGSFFKSWPGAEVMFTDLSTALAEQDDYEAQLDLARRLMQEWHFRIGVHHLRGLISASEAGREYADLAEALVRALWPLVVAEFTRKHGTPPGAEQGGGATVLAMGSLGAQALNARSDLDLLVIYDAKDVEESTGNAQGKRALATRPYYARLTQAFITALTAPMAEGRLYEVDMRLRPSGRSGPVATSIDAFESYQRDEAWTWEHMALTRARVIAGNEELGARLEGFRGDLIRNHATDSQILQDVADMRQRLADAFPPGRGWNLKRGPGALQDIELLAQLLALAGQSDARDTESQIRAGQVLLQDSEVDDLIKARSLNWDLRMAERLLTPGALDEDEIGEGGRNFLVNACKSVGIDALKSQMETHKSRVAAIFDRVLTGTGQLPQK